jgi:hypothetical protein
MVRTNSALVGTDVTDGSIVINQGTFSIETVTNIPNFNSGATITYNAGTTAQFYQTQGPIARPMIYNGITVTNNNQTNASIVGSPITFGGNNTFNIGTGPITFTGNISETGGARSTSETCERSSSIKPRTRSSPAPFRATSH